MSAVARKRHDLSFATRALLLAVAFISCFHTVNARLASLFTSSVTYCSPPDAIIVQQFDVRYYEHNASVVFDIVASSVERVNASAQISLNAYGLKPVNLTFNLCSISSALCPLPNYNFSGSGTLPVPSAYSPNVPGIAYKIPDLEAVAQLTLSRLSSTNAISPFSESNIVACVQSTLSNGWTTRQSAVSWSTGAITIFVILVYAFQTAVHFSSSSFANSAAFSFPPHQHILYLPYFLLHIATTALLRLNYPTSYTAFVLNFAYILGLFHSAHMQDSINDMRRLTGSTLPDGSLDPTNYVGRKNSPYNFTFRKRALVTPPTVSASSTDLEEGIPLFVNAIGINTANAFMTMFFSILIFVAIVGIIAILVYLAVWALARKGNRRCQSLKVNYLTFVRAVCTSLAILLLLPTVIFVFFQWKVRDSWLSVLLSVLLLLSTLSFLGYTFFRCVTTSTNLPFLASLKASPVVFPFAFNIIPIALKALFIGFSQPSGITQVIALIIIEGTTLLITLYHRCFFRSYAKGIPRPPAFAIFLNVIRLATDGLLVAFIPSLRVKPIPRVAIGFVSAVIFSVGIIVIVVYTFINILETLWRERRVRKVRAVEDGIVDATDEKLAPESPTTYSTEVRKPSNASDEKDLVGSPQSPVPAELDCPPPPTTHAKSSLERLTAWASRLTHSTPDVNEDTSQVDPRTSHAFPRPPSVVRSRSLADFTTETDTSRSSLVFPLPPSFVRPLGRSSPPLSENDGRIFERPPSVARQHPRTPSPLLDDDATITTAHEEREIGPHSTTSSLPYYDARSTPTPHSDSSRVSTPISGHH